MIEVRNIAKEYSGRGGPVRALDGVTFACREGEVFGLLGRNGAGKTTCLRILATILSPTSGEARVMGHDVVRDGATVRRHLGFQTGETRLYDRLTGREALRYFGELHGMSAPRIGERIDELTERFDLDAIIDRRIGTLSTGQGQRLSLARTLLHDPSVLILDEPTSGLDILAARETLAHVRALRDEGRAVLFSTHNLSEVDRICDRVGILEGGRLLANESVSALRARFAGDLEDAFVTLVQGESPIRVVGGQG